MRCHNDFRDTINQAAPLIVVNGILAEMEAKFWLRPVSLAANRGFASSELTRIQRLVEEHCQALLDAYIAYHGN